MTTGIKAQTAVKMATYSCVPRPTCVFHFSVAVGLVPFLTCVTQRVEVMDGRRANFCEGKDN